MVVISLIFVFLFLLPIYAHADDFKLEEIEVTASRVQSPTEPYRVVAQIPKEQIAALPVTNIADILAYLPSLDVRSRGASHAQSDISLRGGTADQVLILLNGIPLMDAQTGHYAMNIPVTPALIERIEILQNASSTISGALTGAINIITRDPQADSYQLQLSAGTNSDVTPSFIGSWKRNDARINTAVEYARSNGYYAPQPNTKESEAIQNTDYQLANIYFQTRWQGLDVQAGAQFKNAGLGTGYGYASTDQFDATRTAFVSARYTHPITDAWMISSIGTNGIVVLLSTVIGPITHAPRCKRNILRLSAEPPLVPHSKTSSSVPRTWVSTIVGKRPCMRTNISIGKDSQPRSDSLVTITPGTDGTVPEMHISAIHS